MVYLFLADGFEEIEALTPVDVLRRAGVELKTVSLRKDGFARGSHGIEVKADTTVYDVEIKDVEMIILPGGMPGADNLDKNGKVDEFINAAKEKDAYICAICAAPMILGKRGLTKNKKATCFPGFEKFLSGAEYTANGVERDGKIITAKGMGKAMDFALMLLEALKGKEIAKKTGESFFA